jgi:phage terminase Nu1 subunit (DNA packaging protein)
VSASHASVLNSWKEIAAFLGRGVRTVQRWEHLGLPVHRPKGKDRSAVLAFPDELNQWLAGTPIRFNGQGDGHADGNNATALLELARELQALGEQLAVRLDPKKRPDAEKLVIAVRQVISRLELTDGNGSGQSHAGRPQLVPNHNGSAA